MAVVLVIATMVGLAGPAMLNSFADARASRLTGRLVDTYNVARARAQGSGRAQMVRFTAAGDNGRGQLIAFEGNSSSCRAADWQEIVEAGCGVNGFCTEVVNPSYFEAAGDTLSVTGGELGAWNSTIADICYEPTGITFWREGSNASSYALMSADAASVDGSTIISGGFAIRVQRLDGSGDPLSVARQAMVPLGAAARTVF